MQKNSQSIRAACLNIALAIALGALGAHELKDKVPVASIATWTTASHYHLVMGVGLLIIISIARFAQKTKIATLAIKLVALGMLVFSGSLYLLVLTNLKWLGAITPIGGVLLITGWTCLALSKLELPQQ